MEKAKEGSGVTPILVAFVGHSGSGKTTLVERLIALFTAAGLRVAAVKHDPKGHAAYDSPGKDSWRFRQAGAEAVALAGPTTLATFRTVRDEPQLPELAARLVAESGAVLVLAEGYHTQRGFPRIEVYRPALGRPPYALSGGGDGALAEVIALATDASTPVPGLAAVPHLPLNEPRAVARFLARWSGLTVAP